MCKHFDSPFSSSLGAGAAGSAVVPAPGEGAHPEQLQLHGAGSQPRQRHRGGPRPQGRNLSEQANKAVVGCVRMCVSLCVLSAGAAGSEADERAGDGAGQTRLPGEAASERTSGLSGGGC